MAEFTHESQIPVALDETLDEIFTGEESIEEVLENLSKFLDTVQIKALILKPSVLGGPFELNKIIRLAQKRGIKVNAQTNLSTQCMQTCAQENNALMSNSLV